MNNSSYIKDIWSGIFLGLIEGLTEFLPVSSTAHLILASKLLDLKQELLVTNSIIVQASSVVALLIYFGRLVKSEETFFDKHFLRNSLVCSGVFISVALAFESVIKAALFSVNGIIVGLTLGSILMIVGTLFKRERRYFGVQKSLLLGLIQSLALIPGVSRSGATISGGLLLGLSISESVRFSFIQALILLSVASIYETSNSLSLILENWVLILSSFASGFLFSMVGIKVLDSIRCIKFFFFFIGYRTILSVFLILYGGT